MRWYSNILYIVYIYLTGYAAGSAPSKAGGSNTLCLTDKPGPFSIKFAHYGAIAGFRYNLRRNRNIHPSHKKAVPCAVCQSFCRHNLLLLPGRNICPPEWTLEYDGVLMAGKHDAYNSRNNFASEYICVHQKLEPLESAHGCCANLSVVHAKGAILRSQGYATGKAVTCALIMLSIILLSTFWIILLSE